MTTTTELEILFPDRRFNTSKGEITVSPFKLGQFVEVLRIVNKYLDLLGDGDVSVIGAILEQGEGAISDLVTLASYSTGQDRGWICDLPGDEGIDLFFKVFEVNADFFVRKIREGSERIGQALQPGATGGELPLPASSAPATAGKRSRGTPKPS